MRRNKIIRLPRMLVGRTMVTLGLCLMFAAEILAVTTSATATVNMKCCTMEAVEIFQGTGGQCKCATKSSSESGCPNGTFCSSWLPGTCAGTWAQQTCYAEAVTKVKHNYVVECVSFPPNCVCSPRSTGMTCGEMSVNNCREHSNMCNE